MKPNHVENIKKINELITHDPALIAPIMHLCGEHLDKFREQAKKQNDALLREALGDACHLLAQKRKPPKKTFFKHCIRIIKAIYPDGLTSYHHQGEKDFYNIYLEPFIKEEENVDMDLQG